MGSGGFRQLTLAHETWCGNFPASSIVGLVVEFVVAIDEARVRFTDDAIFCSRWFRILFLILIQSLSKLSIEHQLLLRRMDLFVVNERAVRVPWSGLL